jgi:hypothetical protein
MTNWTPHLHIEGSSPYCYTTTFFYNKIAHQKIINNILIEPKSKSLCTLIKLNLNYPKKT